MSGIKRQGDILFIPFELAEDTERQAVDARLASGKTKKGSQWTVIESGIVAAGEATGHHHVATKSTVNMLNGQMWIVAEEGAQVVHDEHDPIDLDKGVWVVRNQREYTGPERERRVYD